MRMWVCLAAMSAVACGDNIAPVEAPDAGPGEPVENWERPLLHSQLEFDVEARQGRAILRLGAPASSSASFAVGDLAISSVSLDGVALPTALDGDRLDVGLPDDREELELTIEYGFTEKVGFEGYRATGSTLLWPYHCGNLFPCRPDPAEGSTYSLSVEGVPRGQKAVYPEEISAPAPAYMVAFALGVYEEVERGMSRAGTKVSTFHLPGGRDGADAGAEHFIDYLNFFEERYGPYPFGDKMASVSVNWGFGAFGGIEHHPYVHVASAAMVSHEVQAHEIAHGWFGNGVRIACWEDFVLSEGVSQYLALRAVEEADGLAVADEMWRTIESRLEGAVAGGDTEAYPTGCNEIDILTHPLWSRIPYEKGAFFFRAVEEQIGRETLDAAIRSFYLAKKGQAAHMSELIETIESEASADIGAIETAWLRGLGMPETGL